VSKVNQDNAVVALTEKLLSLKSGWAVVNHKTHELKLQTDLQSVVSIIFN
jgi:hypothetical protein